MIYLDNAATTPLDEDVLAEMTPYFCGIFANPQSQHAAGRAAAAAVVRARDKTAHIMGCKPEELYFVSGGTEAGNTALKGVAARYGRGHIAVSAIEHPALIESAYDMQKRGFAVTFIQPDSRGIVTAESVNCALRPDTVFCAVMAVNNETGVIQPYREIGELLRDKGVFYYCDMVQAAGVLKCETDFCDGAGISAHKFYGPKGAGALYIRSGKGLEPLISGGRQERGVRGGTHNVAGIVGLAAALESAERNRDGNNARVAALRDGFLRRVLAEIDGAHLNGDERLRVPSNANISFDGCGGENLLFLLDMKGIAVSTGSACSAGAAEPSHVISAMCGMERAKSALRFSFGKYNTQEEADYTVEALKSAVDTVRRGRV